MKTRKTLVGKIDPEVLAFTTGRDPELDLVLVGVDCIGTAAHVTMLSRLRGRQRVFSDAERKKIVRALVGILRRARRSAFTISRADQDVHLAVERHLTRLLGELGRKVHTGRSRNDQVAVDLRLYAKEQLLGVCAELSELVAALLAFGAEHRDVPMVGRTHLQPAMPSSLGLWAGAHAESLLDDMAVLGGAGDLNNRSPLGSAAGYGVAMDLDRALTARWLGFDAPHANVLYSSNARGKCEAIILSALSQVMLSLSRLAWDLVLYTMPEFDYFRLPAGYTTGSSIMPQKRNPDVLELVRAKASRVMACSLAVSMVVKDLPSGYSRDLQETKEPFLEGIDITRSCVRICARMIKKLKANKRALAAGFRPEVFAADAALEQALAGVPFRRAYGRVKRDLAALSAAGEPRVPSAGETGLAALKQRAAAAEKRTAAERRSYCARISKLLGIRYTL